MHISIQNWRRGITPNIRNKRGGQVATVSACIEVGNGAAATGAEAEVRAPFLESEEKREREEVRIIKGYD